MISNAKAFRCFSITWVYLTAQNIVVNCTDVTDSMQFDRTTIVNLLERVSVTYKLMIISIIFCFVIFWKRKNCSKKVRIKFQLQHFGGKTLQSTEQIQVKSHNALFTFDELKKSSRMKNGKCFSLTWFWYNLLKKRNSLAFFFQRSFKLSLLQKLRRTLFIVYHFNQSGSLH